VFKWGGCRSLTGLALDDLDPGGFQLAEEASFLRKPKNDTLEWRDWLPPRRVFPSAPFSSTRTGEIDDCVVRDCTQPSVRMRHGLAPVQHESFHVVKLIEHIKLESAPRVPEGLAKSKSVVLSATPAGNALRAVSLGARRRQGDLFRMPARGGSQTRRHSRKANAVPL